MKGGSLKGFLKYYLKKKKFACFYYVQQMSSFL